MNRFIAMSIAGALTTLAVVGGTIAAAQAGVFVGTPTTIQPGGEIDVPEMTPTGMQPTAQPYTIVETQTIVITAQPAPTDTVMPTPTEVVDTGPSEREAALTARLNEAYALLKQRDDMYQAKLKEAYNRIQALQTASATASDQPQQGGASSSQPQPQPQPQPTAHHEVENNHPEPTPVPENHNGGGTQPTGGDN